MTYSLYLHIPFCAHRCAYCDFNTYAGQESAIPGYVLALCTEIELVGQWRGKEQGEAGGSLSPGLHTVFFGGGTPSLISPDQFRSILAAIRHNFELQPDAELTIEANPGTVSLDALSQLRELGVNRISLGVQSASAQELRMLERQHSFFDVIRAVEWARKAGLDNLNLDLIYGLPEQRMATWQATVQKAVDLAPEHLSLYALTLEHGTPFGRWASRGLLPLPDPDLAAEMYLWADEYLGAAGYVQYEISNWARNRASSGAQHGSAPQSPGLEGLSSGQDSLRPPSFACKHNLQYWRSLPYLGLGAGAHGYVDGARYSNVLRIKTYIDRLTGGPASANGQEWPLTPATVHHHRNALREDMADFMITGLRLTREGLSATAFGSRFGFELEEIYGREIERLVRLGLLEWFHTSPQPRLAIGHDGERESGLRLTAHARLLANQVFVEFV